MINRHHRLEALNASLKALDPNAVLRRGYSICRRLPDETVVVDAGMLQKGMGISLTFAKGSVIGKVEKVKEAGLGL
jgi:exodeoxyribonuclease VII large subunit